MFDIGDKVAALVRSSEDGRRIQVPQVIIGASHTTRVEAIDRETGQPRINPITGRPVVYLNTVAPVLAKHPLTGALYIRPEETLNFHIPRFTKVEGLDTLNGVDLSLEALMDLYAQAQTERLEALDAAEILVTE